jgi:glycolate oxidase FAD binding subunit
MSMPTEPALSQNEFSPTTQAELQQFLTQNFAGPKRALAPVGGRTALDFGGPLSKPAVTIDMSRLERVVDFPARDMTITVEAGIRIDRLAEVLKAEGQRLPIDIAQPSRATLGGAMAANTSGPRRFGCGTFRDYVIGLTAVTADGRVFHSGGRVVKNVAGYDLCKLLVGSLGTLAVVTQLTLKLKPLPESSVLVWTSFNNLADLDAAVAGLMTSQTRPVSIETLNSRAAALIENQARVGLPTGVFILIVGYEGSARETDWQAETLRRELGARGSKEVSVARDANADRLWTALTEFPVCMDESLAFQASLLPSMVAQFAEQASRFGISLLSHAGNGTVIGKLAEDARDASRAAEILSLLSELASRCGGYLMLLRGDPRWKAALPVGGSPADSHALMRKLKQAFDPEDLLNPGRMFRSE